MDPVYSADLNCQDMIVEDLYSPNTRCNVVHDVGYKSVTKDWEHT